MQQPPPQIIGPAGGNGSLVGVPPPVVVNIPNKAPGVLSRSSVTAAPKPPVKDQWGAPPPGYIPGRGRGATGFAGGVSRDDSTMDQDRGDYSDRNFDEFTGYNENLFKDSEYDEDDRQADILYDAIDVAMDTRRRSRREKRLKEELAKKRAQNPTIHQQFADLKQALTSVTREEWEALPDIGDTVHRAKRKAPQRFQRVPDSLILDAQESTRLSSTAMSGLDTPIGATLTPLPTLGGTSTPLMATSNGLSTPIATPYGLQTPMGLQTPYGLQTPLGLQTPMGLRTPMEAGGSHLRDVGEARGAALGAKLDSVVDTPMTTKSVVDPKGYLTALNSMRGATSGLDLDSISKTRSLMKSITKTNPKDSPGWIAYARLEERAGRMKQALHVIAEGCTMCPKDEEVWLEAARLSPTPKQAKEFLAVATAKHLPNSVRLWVERANKEDTADGKRRILKNALTRISNSVRLWQEAVALEDPTNARILLCRAVECVPQAVELWLQLANLSSHQDAKKALNEARKKCPTSSEIWVAAAQLEETKANLSQELLTKLVVNGVKRLSDNGVEFDRQLWLQHAMDSEGKGCPVTCRAIVAAISQFGDFASLVDGSRQGSNATKVFKAQRLEEAEKAATAKRNETARAILEEALKVLPAKKALWLALVELDLKANKFQTAAETLAQATKACPNKEIFWLMLAKQQWVQKDVEAARSTLQAAREVMPDSEAVLLALVKVERESGDIETCRTLLTHARSSNLNTAAVWMHSVQLERRIGAYDAAKTLVIEALKEHIKAQRLWLIAAAIEWERPGGPYIGEAIGIYEKAVHHIPGSIPIWTSFIDLYIKTNNFAKARTIREKATLLLPEAELVWLRAIEIEKLDPESPKGAVQQTISRALQKCPRSGLLLSEAVWVEDKAKRGAKVFEALNKSESNPYCVLAAAKVFWMDGKEKKAREWFVKSHELGPKNGETYGIHLAFEIQYKKLRNIIGVFMQATEADPNSGVRWNIVAKRVENWSKTINEKLIEFVKEYHPEVFTPEGPFSLQGVTELGRKSAK
eukprot:Blabericola_migrator_1__13052@NODE_87_length_14713_cov_55_061450_g78_i0_p2_GENE_NODE_87_length_14713_cov_55_061450_g78_i0NODE_87_length_14713_cov_55_061450_g78_i0_p2_ORF_typecomplete_len1041_score228_21PRP1_N/PF06424_12/1_3e42Suf/PF05843_14/0_0027Suf/PF05843_14/0_18Suf/PF05843_14/0_18Suf/PF05843_14/4_6e06Suf/PF05843_14/7_3e11Suf/PF05843_14/0_19TPR_15/PF13429_6/11TPR_15/PF13429_6/0_0012TPR_15/PF13429_6/0_021TPR_15/PF13429_6/1_5e11TPR_15/PF13429_6/0_91TPR_15/PF13429_6/0_1TPR_19/PF14559_6/1_3TPR_19